MRLPAWRAPPADAKGSAQPSPSDVGQLRALMCSPSPVDQRAAAKQFQQAVEAGGAQAEVRAGPQCLTAFLRHICGGG